MATEVLSPEAPTVRVDAHSLGLTDEQFFQLCQDNRDLRFEMTARGELIIMAPTGSEMGRRNARINQRLLNWADADSTGVVFDSSAGFRLPNGARVSPDASWVSRERYEAVPPEEREKFAPVCPDFVVELRSPSDNLQELQGRMAEYVENGAQLGWLLDPSNRRVYVYRPGREVEILEGPETVSGDPVLPGFVLSLQEIW
ncbi:MAG TPA: Uma2 family endonuclease [Pyrinomonadaceae bacterium]|nr:Uma2 family endonuclease [Pyrinomonadaceae bacterium]